MERPDADRRRSFRKLRRILDIDLRYLRTQSARDAKARS